MASTMHLEFKQAMTDFKTMFPEMEDEVIEAVLRANDGAVDATVDQLLTMSTDNLNERIRFELEQNDASPDRPNCSSPRTTARPLANHDKDSEITTLIDFGDSSVPLAVRRNWVPKLLGPLPPTFLRIPSDSRPDHNLEIDDDKLALYLQNEEFMNELRWNQEFMTALDNEHGQKSKEHDDEAAFKERLKNMGKLSRKKFAQFSRMFSRGAGRGGGETPPRGPPDRRPLQEEHSDDEERPRPAAKPADAHTHLV